MTAVDEDYVGEHDYLAFFDVSRGVEGFEELLEDRFGSPVPGEARDILGEEGSFYCRSRDHTRPDTYLKATGFREGLKLEHALEGDRGGAETVELGDLDDFSPLLQDYGGPGRFAAYLVPGDRGHVEEQFREVVDLDEELVEENRGLGYGRRRVFDVVRDRWPF